MEEPVWIDESIIARIHASTIALHGGASGIRDEGLLESALARPRNLWMYADSKPDIATLAASLAHGLAKNHPFFDGNKRTAWILCRLMLRINGANPVASQSDRIDAMLALASGEWTESEFAGWLRHNVVQES